MAESAVDLYEYVTDSGVIIPDTSTIKGTVEETYRNAFGNGVDLTAESVGGRLVERDTTALSQTIGVVAQNANQFNPHYATGAYLDHLANMFGFSRQAATRTRVYAKLSGNGGTTVPSGSLAKTENGDTFVLENNVVIDNTTLVGYGWFVAEEYGSVPCGVGELNSIQSNVTGWTGITNENDSVSATNPTVIGSDVETDAHLRERLLVSVWSGVGFVQTIRARVADVKGVKSCVVLENNGSKPKTIRGVTIPGHSVCVCVDGGDNNDVAKAIYASRSAGCGYTSVVEGGTSITVDIDIPDETNGVVHTVKFVRPPATLKAITVELTIKKVAYSGSTPLATAITSAINAYLTDAPIGVALTDYDIANAITAQIPTVTITSISVMTEVGGEAKPISEYDVPAYMKYDCTSLVLHYAEDNNV